MSLRALDPVRRREPSRPSAPLGPFTREQTERIRQGKMTACLVTAGSRPPRPDTVRTLRRFYRVLDGDGNPSGETRVETTRTVLTVRHVSQIIDLTLDRDVELDGVKRRLALGDEHARACGYRSAVDLRQAWQAQHPRTLLVRLVMFEVGDTRDRAPLLARTAGATLDPSRALDPDAPLVPADAQQMITNIASVRHAKLTAKERRARQARSLAIRLKEAQRREDADEMARIGAELKALENEIREAA